jgi:RNA recognition motif-containing protein
MSKQLFVGNLSVETSEAELNLAFARWGGSGAAIPTNDSGRSRGFGLVEVPDDQLNAAIAAMRGAELNGRILAVHEARWRADLGGYGPARGGYYSGGCGGYGEGGAGGGGRW